MLKLHGFAVSNYYNMIKLALLEKGVAFEEVLFFGGQTPESFSRSPRGKVPVLETEQGFLSETDVILDYIEQTQGGTPLLPSDPFAKAKVWQLSKQIELYIELSARVFYPEAFFGTPVAEPVKTKAWAELQMGIAALQRNGVFAPYVAGEQLTIADTFFAFSMDLACAVGQKVYGVDLLEDFPQAKALLALLQQNPHVQSINQAKLAQQPMIVEMLRKARG